MNIWLIEIGEPFPTDVFGDRLLRCGLLANVLISRGHDVVWWSSTFDHSRKQQRFHTDTTLVVNEHYKLKLLHSISYNKNISIRRLLNQYVIAKKFSKLAKLENKPDLVLCCVPTIEFSIAAVNYCKIRNIPIILDIQDLWPDIFFDILPNQMRMFAKSVYHIFFRSTYSAFKNCTSITGVSEEYLKWGLNYASRARNNNDRVFPLGYERNISSTDQILAGKDSLNKFDIDDSKFTCWFIGSFGRTYDLIPIIEAARKLELEGLGNIQFILSGDGEKYQEWQNSAKDLKSVIFTGWVNAPQIAYLMSIADIGLMAYAKGAPQGLPNKIFEYLSAGLPILSSLSSDGEAASLLAAHKCGFHFEAGNSNSFLEKFSLLMSDDHLLSEMSTNSRKLFEKQFDSKIIYTNFAEYLERASHM